MGNIEYYGQLFNGDKVTPAIAAAANVARSYGLALLAARTPVDTGLLKSNWKAKLEGQGIRWFNGTDYASFVEYGTRRMKPRHMLTNSIPDISEVFEAELAKNIGKAIGAQIVSEMVATPDQPSWKNPQTPKQSGGFSKRTFSKSYLFSNPRDILSGKQKEQIAAAKPLLRRGGLPG